MDEGRIQRIEVDFRLGLLISDKTETVCLHIAEPCCITCEGRTISLTPEDAPSLAPALVLFNAEVADVSIQRTGHLTVKLKDGRSLEADANERYEAWEIGWNGFLFVCSPGGKVTYFQQRGVQGQSDDPPSPS
jgi:hypothetical protein